MSRHNSTVKGRVFRQEPWGIALSAELRTLLYRGRMRNALLASAVLLALPVMIPAADRPNVAASTISTAVLHYTAPAVKLLRDDGKSISLPDEMNDGRPVVLNFIFTSCSSICPLMSQVFAQFQQRLGPEAANVHIMSISIDPEEDTPARLREYAHKFHAAPGWQHYSGTIEASLAAQRAFNVWRGDKMSHSAVIFMRSTPDSPWLRIDGFASSDELLHQFRQLRQVAAQNIAAR